MKLRMGWVLTIVLGGALAAITSCGGRAQVDGTDSNTHWLKSCDSDSQCGKLSCICGVCSSACDETSNCTAFGAEARCEVPAGCDARGPTACVLPSASGGTGGSGSGGSTGTIGGTSASGGGASSADCSAMDARSNGDECISTVGYAWNGSNCQAVVCGCAGGDCDALFATADDCDHAYNQCYHALNLGRACAVHSDCVLQQRTCCPTCTVLGDTRAGDMLIATNVGALSLRDVGNCIGPDPQAACSDCAQVQSLAAYAACIDGICRLLDVTANAACEAPEDCRLATRDCCDCGGDFSGTGLVAVSGDAPHSYCAPDRGCAECEGNPPPQQARATCIDGLCAVGIIPK